MAKARHYESASIPLNLRVYITTVAWYSGYSYSLSTQVDRYAIFIEYMGCCRWLSTHIGRRCRQADRQAGRPSGDTPVAMWLRRVHAVSE